MSSQKRPSSPMNTTTAAPRRLFRPNTPSQIAANKATTAAKQGLPPKVSAAGSHATAPGNTSLPPRPGAAKNPKATITPSKPSSLRPQPVTQKPGESTDDNWLAGVDTTSIARASPPDLAKEPSTADTHLAAVLAEGAPASWSDGDDGSPKDLRLFALRHARTDDALHHGAAILRDANKVDAKTFSPGQPDFIDLKLFEVREGEPGLTGRIAAYQSTARVVFTQEARQAGADDPDVMDRLRRRLLSKKVEAYWACGKETDPRAVGDFFFEKNNDHPKDDLKEVDASAFIKDICTEYKHPFVATFGRFQYSRDNGLRHERQVKFLHPTSVQQLDALARGKQWQYKGYTVTFEPSTTVLFPTNACSIAAYGAGRLSETTLLTELWGWVAEYNKKFSTEEALLADHRRAHGKWFIATPTSFALSIFICQQTPMVVPPYQLVYELNCNNLRVNKQVTEDAARKRAAQEKKIADNTEQTRAWQKTMEAKLERREEKTEAMGSYMLQWTAASQRYQMLHSRWQADDAKLTRKIASVEAAIEFERRNVEQLEDKLENSHKEQALWSATKSDVSGAMASLAQITITRVQGQIQSAKANLEAKRAELNTLNDAARPAPELPDVPVPRLLLPSSAPEARFEDVTDENSDLPGEALDAEAEFDGYEDDDEEHGGMGFGDGEVGDDREELLDVPDDLLHPDGPVAGPSKSALEKSATVDGARDDGIEGDWDMDGRKAG